MNTPASQAERRQLTVMFCDLVGSTALSARLDPEDLQDATHAFLKYCADQIEQAGGYVARYAGDSVLAYFGYPKAHENDAERAILAALAIRDNRFSLPMPLGLPLAMRSGIATGQVVVGELIGKGASEERAVSGETANLAARLQAFAAPNTVVVSDTTRRLAASTFRFRDLGRPELKGISLNGPVWEAAGPNETIERFRARGAAGAIPFVGRETELHRIVELRELATKCGGRIVSLVGEAGIGKSRLLHELRERSARASSAWLEGGCAQIFSNTPLHAVSQIFRRLLAGGNPVSPEESHDRLGDLLGHAGVSGENDIALIADMIGITTSDTQSRVTMGADRKRHLLISALTEWILGTALRQPTTMIVEDLHWSDPSTLEFLQHLAKHMRAAPLLLIVTMRNDVVANWHGDPHHECIRLDRLSGAQCSRIAHAVADERLSDTALQSVARRADGIPLFAEELGRLLAQRDDVAAQVPETLSDLLMARLDALGPAKHFAQTASVLGTEFDPALFRAVAGLDEPDARSALCTLANADIVVLDGDHPTGCCTFRHAMIRDAAYGTLMKGRRRTLHRRAASVIGDHFPHLAAVQPEIPAHHWSEAEDFEHAVPAWREAARQASLKSAFAEAQQACERAIDAIDRLTETPEHEEQELEIRSIYADVLRITRGYAAPATKEAVADVKRLAERRGDLRKQCAHVAGAWMVASSGGNYPLAEKLVNQLMPLAHADGGIDELGVAYALQLTTQYRTGDLLGAEETFRIARPYFVSVEFHKRAGAAGQTYGNAALNAWLLDDQTEASSRISECLRISSGILSPYEEAFATYMAALLAVLRRSHSEARNFARQSLDLSDRNGFPQFAAISRIALGRAEAELGSPETALVLMHDGFTRMKANRSRNGLTMLLTWLAEVEAQSGNERKAIETLTEALETNPHERFFRPETLRVRAELYERCGHREKAQTDLAGAVALSKAMSARLSHARAAAIELSRKNR